jgi:hypothetical protein
MPTSCSTVQSVMCSSRPLIGARDAVEAEARALPLPGLEREIDVLWEG